MKIITTRPHTQDDPDGVAGEGSAPLELLLEQIGARSRVAVLDASAMLTSRLAAARCEVLNLTAASCEDRGGELLEQHRPAKVVLPDPGASGRPLSTLLREIAARAPGADVVVGFWNAASASTLLAQLAGGRSSHPTATDDEVRNALSEAGYGIAVRRSWRAHGGQWFTEDADRALSQFFSQLNPTACEDWILYVGRVGLSAPDRQEPVPRLLSVVVRNHSTRRLPLLDQTIFSLACQSYRPLEIVLVTQARESGAAAAFEGLLERHCRLGEFKYRVLSVPSDEDIRGRLVNLGVEAARGQYLAFLDDDDVVYPHHYVRLVQALQRGTAAWAVSRTRTARFTFDSDGNLYCTKKGLLTDHGHFSLPDLVRCNYIAAHAFVLDRARLGRVPIAFSEQITRAEDYVLLLRLATCFPPIFLSDTASCEYRMRDDGTNTNMMAPQPEHVRAREQLAWQASHAHTEALKPTLQVLLPMSEYEAVVRGSVTPAPAPGAPPPLRHLLVDAINHALKGRWPSAHVRVKSVGGRLARMLARR